MGTEAATTLATNPDFHAWLLSPVGGCMFDIKDIGNGLYAGIKPLLFHWTLIVGEIGDTCSYADRWCYADQDRAVVALRAWDGQGDPGGGWHRHPATGRRRPDGDPAREHVAA